jgi:GxxExxY protein
MKHQELTQQIIKAFYKVYNTLGFGFLEKVYENAMCIELSKMGIQVVRQKAVTVYYEDKVVGYYNADLTIENLIICELKAGECLVEENERQLINYLKATNIEVGLLLNFGKRPEIKRKIFDNDKKHWITFG